MYGIAKITTAAKTTTTKTTPKFQSATGFSTLSSDFCTEVSLLAASFAYPAKTETTTAVIIPIRNTVT